MNRIPGSVTLVALALAVPLQAQDRMRMTEREAVAVLRDDRTTPERDRAIALALQLGPRAGSELRLAIINAAWAEIRGETNRPRGLEAKFQYMTAVAQLQDPRAIPFLIEVLPNGLNASNALADLGSVAFAAVMEAAKEFDNGTPLYRNVRRAGGALTALRFMLEDGSLSPQQLARVRELVGNLLAEPQYPLVARPALVLAVALGDSEVRRFVEAIATDRVAAAAHLSPFSLSDGTTRNRYYEADVARIQTVARQLLAGVSVPPLRRPFPPGRDPSVG